MDKAVEQARPTVWCFTHAGCEITVSLTKPFDVECTHYHWCVRTLETTFSVNRAEFSAKTTLAEACERARLAAVHLQRLNTNEAVE